MNGKVLRNTCPVIVTLLLDSFRRLLDKRWLVAVEEAKGVKRFHPYTVLLLRNATLFNLLTTHVTPK